MLARFFLYGFCLLIGTSGCAGFEPITHSSSHPSAAGGGEPMVEAPIEERIVDELNFARTNPSGYADLIERRLDTFNGKEGKKAIRETIVVLRNTSPLPPLTHSDRVALAARDHVMDQGPSGQIGHGGSDGSDPFSRIDRYVATRGAAENIQYGRYGARDIVMELLIDDGVPDRGHRINILNPNYQFVGVATGPHQRYGHMCVMDFTYAYQAW